MSLSSRPPPVRDATSLVPLPGPFGDRTGSGDEGRERVARLWEAIRRTRAELVDREAREGRIVRLFDAEIRPRERAFTDAVLRLTARLITHHERTPLAAAERALLGLWIDENLRSLATHPFAAPGEASALSRRWSAHLGAAADPLDAALARLHARGGRGSPAAGGRTDAGAPRDAAPSGGSEDSGADGSGARDGGGARRRETEERHRSADEGVPGANGRAGRRTGGGRTGAGADTPDDAAEAASGRLVSRLFRRLARALHPDLEPDETRRLDKHRLMSECLRARDEHDVDALLSLHDAHVGPLPDDIADGDPATLARLLGRQLDALRGRLRRAVEGDALRRTVVARYGGGGDGAGERLVAAHAAALDAETARVDALEAEAADADGLLGTLRARREIELDRLAIDELTGCLEPV